MSGVKIVATIGPQTSTPAMLEDLCKAGIDVARLNGAHADFGWHAKTIRAIRDVNPSLPILFDMPGIKVRTGTLREKLSVARGDLVIFAHQPSGREALEVPVTHPRLDLAVGVNDTILADDGTIRFTVIKVSRGQVTCRAEGPGILLSGKGLNLPGAKLQNDGPTDRDRELMAFALEQNLDFVGVSFAQDKKHVETVRAHLGKDGPGVISKVETRQAIENLDEIIAASDALMIDRGDLAAETSLETVAIQQKHVLALARERGCPAIVATEMLQSMVHSPSPTKAEVSDITNAVLDGADALMLSAETAVGQYPLEAVRTMRSIIDSARGYMQGAMDRANAGRGANVPLAIGEAISLICRRLDVTKIIAITLSGYAARMISSQLPRQPIIGVSSNLGTARRLNLLYGTTGVHVKIPFSRTDVAHIPKCLEALWRRGDIQDDDLILVTAVTYPRSGNRMNFIQTHKVEDLRKNLGWSGKSRGQASKLATSRRKVARGAA